MKHAVLLLSFAACVPQAAPQPVSSTSSGQSTLSSAATKQCPALRSSVALGLISDVQAAIGSSNSNDSVSLPGALQAIPGYGLEYVTLASPAQIGDVLSTETWPTASVFGRDRPTMPIRLLGTDGAPKLLYQAMVAANENTDGGTTTRASSNNRLVCTLDASGDQPLYQCTVTLAFDASAASLDCAQ